MPNSRDPHGRPASQILASPNSRDGDDELAPKFGSQNRKNPFLGENPAAAKCWRKKEKGLDQSPKSSSSSKNIFRILEVTKQSAKAGSFERKAWIRAMEMDGGH
jgi:hypothetical protein